MLEKAKPPKDDEAGKAKEKQAKDDDEDKDDKDRDVKPSKSQDDDDDEPPSRRPSGPPVDELDRIVLSSKAEVDEAIKWMQAKGYKAWPDGRPLAEVIITKDKHRAKP